MTGMTGMIGNELFVDFSRGIVHVRGAGKRKVSRTIS
jgi:hypothetical protein